MISQSSVQGNTIAVGGLISMGLAYSRSCKGPTSACKGDSDNSVIRTFRASGLVYIVGWMDQAGKTGSSVEQRIRPLALRQMPRANGSVFELSVVYGIAVEPVCPVSDEAESNRESTVACTLSATFTDVRRTGHLRNLSIQCKLNPLAICPRVLTDG